MAFRVYIKFLGCFHIFFSMMSISNTFLWSLILSMLLLFIHKWFHIIYIFQNIPNSHWVKILYSYSKHIFRQSIKSFSRHINFLENILTKTSFSLKSLFMYNCLLDQICSIESVLLTFYFTGTRICRNSSTNTGFVCCIR